MSNFVETEKALSQKNLNFTRIERVKYWSTILLRFGTVQTFVQLIGVLSGILLVRTLSKEEYAFFTIAATIQGSMAVLADSGVGIALSAIGGKVWQDRYRFGQLINSAIMLRRYFSFVSILTITPILFWMLISKGTSVSYSIIMAVAVLAGLTYQLNVGILSSITRLHSQIKKIQTLDLASVLVRLLLLILAYFTFLNAPVAISIAGAVSVMQFYVLMRWSRDYADLGAPVDDDDKAAILKVVKSQIPNAIFYCIQGQLTIWLISIFGSTHNIAEIGALGRLAVIFTIFNSIMSSILLPAFSRCQTYKKLLNLYWQIISGTLLVVFLLLTLSWLFPEKLLWVIGKNYSALGEEVFFIAMNAAVTTLMITMWSINCSKAWIKHSWFNIPFTIAIQILMILTLDVSTVKGVIVFASISAIPSIIVNAILTYRGFLSFRSYAID